MAARWCEVGYDLTANKCGGGKIQGEFPVDPCLDNEGER